MDAVQIIQDDIKELRSDVRSILEVQVRQTASLEQHIKRTNLLEESLGLLRAEVRPLSDNMVARAAIVRLGGIVLALMASAATIVEVAHRLGWL